ncbi:hypothetical protein MKX07_001532, partial [Trichoderma sp. CBMAI-0711]
QSFFFSKLFHPVARIYHQLSQRCLNHRLRPFSKYFTRTTSGMAVVADVADVVVVTSPLAKRCFKSSCASNGPTDVTTVAASDPADAPTASDSADAPPATPPSPPSSDMDLVLRFVEPEDATMSQE